MCINAKGSLTPCFFGGVCGGHWGVHACVGCSVSFSISVGVLRGKCLRLGARWPLCVVVCCCGSPCLLLVVYTGYMRML